jgi:acyl dehydratase
VRSIGPDGRVEIELVTTNQRDEPVVAGEAVAQLPVASG